MPDFLHKNRLFFYGIAIATIAAWLDLWSKKAAFTFLEAKNYALKITEFFNLVTVWNNGVSFGMFSNFESAKFFILTTNLIILAILLIWLWRNQTIYLSWALGLVIGGALGNIIDRIENGAVADFLDFHYMGYHWPAFNLADSFIFIGVTLLLLEGFFVKDSLKKSANSNQSQNKEKNA